MQERFHLFLFPLSYLNQSCAASRDGGTGRKIRAEQQRRGSLRHQAGAVSLEGSNFFCFLFILLFFSPFFATKVWTAPGPASLLRPQPGTAAAPGRGSRERQPDVRALLMQRGNDVGLFSSSRITKKMKSLLVLAVLSAWGRCPGSQGGPRSIRHRDGGQPCWVFLLSLFPLSSPL